MLDLTKQYGIYQGISFFGDHEDNSVVYYLPDEVRLDEDQNAHYEMDLMLFQKSNIVSNKAIDLDSTAGSILQMGVCCTVEDKRLEKALDELKEAVELPKNLRLTQPLWKEGTVDLMVLDRQKNQSAEQNETGFVKQMLGSQKPSLMTNNLKSIFNIRLDRNGTEMIYQALQGSKSSLAGVMYDLKFPALLPAANLRITANLSRCQETASHELGMNLTYQDENIRANLKVGLGWLTDKMEENGDIKVELFSPAETEAEKKNIQQLVGEFKEKILEQLFAPQISTQTPDVQKALQNIGQTNVMQDATTFTPSVKVSYVFKNEKIEQNKVFVVDYRERFTVIKTHNPQSHLWLFGLQLGSKFSDYVTKVELNDFWRTQCIHTSIDSTAFDSTNLKFAEVALWKQELGTDPTKPLNEFAIPDGTSPMIAVLSKDHPEAEISWTRNDNDEVGYYYQVRFGYGDEEIVSEPFLSYSSNLMIVPELCIFCRQLHVIGCGIDYSIIRNVNVRLDISDPTGLRAPQYILLAENHNEDTLMVRSRYHDSTSIQMTQTIDFMDGSKVKSESSVFGSEIPIYSPLMNRKLTLVFKGVNDKVQSVLMDVTVQSAKYTGELKKRFVISDLSQMVTQVDVQVLDKEDTISYALFLIGSDGELTSMPGGQATGEPIHVKLSDESGRDKDKLCIEWNGCCPEDAGLKRVEVYVVPAGKEEVKYEFKGSTVPAPVTLKIGAEEDVTVRIVKRYYSGEKETLDNVPVRDGVITVSVE